VRRQCTPLVDGEAEVSDGDKRAAFDISRSGKEGFARQRAGQKLGLPNRVSACGDGNSFARGLDDLLASSHNVHSESQRLGEPKQKAAFEQGLNTPPPVTHMPSTGSQVSRGPCADTH
jgi:hypothetical protein